MLMAVSKVCKFRGLIRFRRLHLYLRELTLLFLLHMKFVMTNKQRMDLLYKMILSALRISKLCGFPSCECLFVSYMESALVFNPRLKTYLSVMVVPIKPAWLSWSDFSFEYNVAAIT